MGMAINSRPPPSAVPALSLRQAPQQIRHCFAPFRRWSRLRSPPLFQEVPPRKRVDIFRSRCWITNTDVHFGHVSNDEEKQEELPAVASTCSVPIVHINSDVLETDSLNLLPEDAHVDSLFMALPVLSEEEQNSIAATPAHSAGLYTMYASCFVGNMVEQLWNFAWPAAIALIHPSLLPVAVIGFFTKFVIIVGGPLVGQLMDRFPRVPAYNCLSFVQAAAQLLSAAMIVHAHAATPTVTSTLLFRPWFIVLALAGAVERLCGLALGIAMERDWVVLLAGTNRPIALAEANAVISRIDLFCEIAGSSLFGILLSKYEPVTCLKLAAGLMIWGLPVVAVLTWLTNKLSAGVLDRSKSPEACGRTYSKRPLPDAEILSQVEIGVDAIKEGWIEYLKQPVLPASIAYVLLYFNIVLTPGGLMTAFLTQRGLNPSLIGGFSGLCAFMGIAATFVSTSLVRQLGVLKAGAAGLVLQASLLTVAVAVYCSGSLSRQTPLIFFLCLIVLSRLGHMSYDVVGTQILQTGIPTSKSNLIGTTEVSVASLAEFVMLGVAIVANDVSHFGLLAVLSLSSVLGAASVFCQWLTNPTDEQRSLFYFDPPY